VAQQTAQFILYAAIHARLISTHVSFVRLMPVGKKHKYNARVLPCPFKCGLYCKSASGLTQHRNVCSLNPANRRASTPSSYRTRTPTATPRTPTASPSVVLPSPGPLFHTPRNHHGRNSQPHTPPSGSPRRNQWMVNGRGVRSRIHPLLDG
jgi:hypothetical protein